MTDPRRARQDVQGLVLWLPASRHHQFPRRTDPSDIAPGNGDHRNPLLNLCKGLCGYLFAAQGYRAPKLPRPLAERGIQLITTLRKNMKATPRTEFEQALLRRRWLIEKVFDELKTLCPIAHTRHRSVGNLLVKLMAGIVADCVSDNSPPFKLMRVKPWAAP